MLSLGSDGGGVGTELIAAEPEGEGTTDATGAFCGFRINRCGLIVEVCASFFLVTVPLDCWLAGPVSCWAEAKGIG